METREKKVMHSFRFILAFARIASTAMLAGAETRLTVAPVNNADMIIMQKLVQGTTVPLKLTLWDQFGDEFRVDSKLSVDRSTTSGQRLARTQSSVYDSGGVPDTSEPSGREGPDVPAALRAAVMAKTREQEGN
jgi:hypothetical protein